MLTIDALRNPSRESGFNYVGRCGGGKKKPWRAQKNAGQKYGSPNTFRGPTRATPEDAAQDFCDYINGLAVAQQPQRPLRSAGHKYKAAKVQRDPEVEAALGVLRDARAQRAGKRGYVYLIVEDLPGGGLHYGKIGYSTNPRKRVAELQTGNPRPLKLLYAMPGTEEDERTLHAKHAHTNVLQEWFVVNRNIILEFPAKTSAAQCGGQPKEACTT